MSDHPKYPESPDVTNWDQFTQKHPKSAKENLILEKKFTGNYEVSDNKPENPILVEGISLNIGNEPRYQDTEKQLERIKISSDAFMFGANKGWELSHDVFEKDSNDLKVVSDALVEAAKGFKEKIGFGMGGAALRVKAIQDVAMFTDPKNDNWSLTRGFQDRKRSFMKKALSNMPKGTTTEEFDESVKKLMKVRSLLREDFLPSNNVSEADHAKAEFKDGFIRAFNGIAETYRSQPNYNEKYWYLK